MKINVNTGKRTPQMRILSAFMAVLIFSLTFVKVFEWTGGNIALAAGTASDGIIRPIPDYSRYKGPDSGKDPNDGDYVYTGRIKPVAIDLYDYMTDKEINDNNWNYMNSLDRFKDNNNGHDDYSVSGCYTYYNRYNPYDKFNKKISDMTISGGIVLSPHEQNVTLKYVSDYPITGDVYAHIFVRNKTTNVDTPYKSWPGEKTEANSDRTEFTYTVIYDDLPQVSNNEEVRIIFNGGDGKWETEHIIISSLQKDKTYVYGNYSINPDPNKIQITLTGFNTASPPTNIHIWNSDASLNAGGWPGPSLSVSGSTATYTFTYGPGTGEYNFVPYGFIFNRQDNNTAWQTKDCTRQMTLGHNYYFALGSKDINGDGRYYLMGQAFNYKNHIAMDLTPTTPDPAENIYTDIPKLYLGNFLAKLPENAQTNPHSGSGGDNDDPNSYTEGAKNFISPSCNNNGRYNNFYWQANIAQRPVTINGDQKKDRPYAAIQGLVDQTLNSSGQITQGGTPLPYFNSAWASETNPVMKAWESTPSQPIAFPFYEVLKTADNTVEGFEPGTNSTVSHKAKFYEFNSKDANLTFNSATRQFTETNNPIKAATGTIGLFPFTTNDSYRSDGSSGYKNNYGFGAKFEMSFKLTANGKTETVDDNGDKIADGAGTVSTRFNFSGDDDIWIFIDGNLVLDLGGDHAETTGYIDFSAKKAVADKAIKYGWGVSDSSDLTNWKPDDLNVDGISQSVDIGGLINGYHSDTDTYDTSIIHTMTIFYMERGMAESNLLIRFNFPPESIYSKLKVKEQTDFSGVNNGLKNLTQKAAENDVFQYHVENKGTAAADVLKENSYYGTDDSYIRSVQDVTTKLTPLTTYSGNKYFEPTNSTAYQDVANVSYNWVDEYALLNGSGNKMSSDKNIGGKTDSNGYMYLLHGIPKSGDEAEIKSSGEFEGQFKRYSLMKVTQSDTLYTPSTHATNGSAAALTSIYPVGGTPANRTISGYYNLKENYVFTTVDNNIKHNISNGAEFNFRNNLESTITNGGDEGHKDNNEDTPVAMTVQFVNSPKVGTMTITKTVKDASGYDEAYKGEFKFKLTLSDIFGITGVAPDSTYNKYSDIAVTRLAANGSAAYPHYKLTDTTSNGNYYGEFKLKAGEILIIDNIPINTNYTVQEDLTNTPNYEQSTGTGGTTNATAAVVEGTLNGTKSYTYTDNNNNGIFDTGDTIGSETNNNAVIVNTHIKSVLTLTKNVTKTTESSWPSTMPSFKFRVTLTIPSEIDINHYPLTDNNSNSITVHDSSGVKYFDVEFNNVNTSTGETITISGLPNGIGYTVEEIDIPENWKQTTSTGLTGTIKTETNTATITNNYTEPPKPVIKLTKVDVTENNAIITAGTADFKLLKLKKKDSHDNTINWADSTVLANFNTFVNGSSYTLGSDPDYVEDVYPTSGSYQTTNGVLTLNEISTGNPFTAGDIYFFYEVNAPTGYQKDNTVTADKILTLVGGDNFIRFPNSPAPMKVTVKKVDKDDTTKGLPGAEFDLFIHETIKSYPSVTGDSGYSTKSIESVPQPSENIPNPLPVLYQTNSNKISYEWSEETDDPDYYYIKFNNTLGWSNVKMVAGSTEIDSSGSNGNVYKFKNDDNATTIYFTNGTARTIDIDISSLCADTTLYPNAKRGYGYTFTPSDFTDPGGDSHGTDASGNYLVQIETPAPTSSNKISVTDWNSTTTGGYTDYIWFYHGTDGRCNVRACYYNINNNTCNSDAAPNTTKTVTINGIKHYFFGFSYNSSYQKIMFFNNNNDNLYAITPQDLSTNMKGKIYKKGNWSGANITNNHPPGNNNITIVGDFNNKSVGIFNCDDVTSLYANANYMDMGSTTYSVNTISYPTTPVDAPLTTDNFSAEYQPEDRYAFITDINGNADSNNFITIDTDINDPYIMFYDSNDNSVLTLSDVNKPLATSGLRLHSADKDGSDGAPYKIRLPKNAYSFVISSGSGHTPDTNNKISLYDNSGYHHAGSIFYIKAELDGEDKPTGDGILDETKGAGGIIKRIGYTASKTDITYPINPKTDADYIFFTDTNNNLADSNGRVYAYYYGNVDGEYKPWPGVPSQRRYQDNNGKWVYVFQPPTSTNGKYSKVIFNDGTRDQTRKITAAQDITPRTIYTTDSTTSAYGEQTLYPYSVSTSQKSTTNTTSYAINASTSYMYFNNNGTYNFERVSGQNRFVLDDLHFEFFADLNGTVCVGTTSPGYIPDKLSGENIYKIAIPDGAAYFRVNNGSDKGTPGSTCYNTRVSEIIKITPNGLFKFVESTTPSEVWDNSTAAGSIAALDDYAYKLKDDFTAATTDIKLATVVTGNTSGHEGEQAYIKENSLKRVDPDNMNSAVDIEYLDHTAADEGQNSAKTEVKVKKKATSKATVNDYTDSDTYYYWKEVGAPSGYKLPDSPDDVQKIDMSAGTTTYNSTTQTYTNTFGDEAIAGGKVTLNKAAKEQVGTTTIGSLLKGAEFKLVKLDPDGTDSDEIVKFKQVTSGTEGSYTTSSNGTYNYDNDTPSNPSDDIWLKTGNDGKLVLNNVPIGSYYLEEQKAPAGYSNLESDGTTKKKIYFSVGKTGENILDKEITMSDEMVPAYIKLYEHINEKRDAWGNPTFIFKITQTHYYSNSTLTALASQKTHIVALTVNDDDTLDSNILTSSATGKTFTSWKVEATDEDESGTLKYQGMYHIDSQGRIRVEPGSYEITRVSVSRYEFVTSASTNQYLSGDTITQTETTDDTEHDNRKKVIITGLAAGKTIDVHYYDQVAYYDKFTHVDTAVNKFYTLDNSKQNNTIKGIRVKDITNVDTDANVTIDQSSDKLKLYFIYVDGTEREVTETSEKQKLRFTYEGNDTTFPTKFSTTVSGFTITSHTDFKDNIYTLKATYDNKFSTNFDLVFERTP